MLLRGTCFWWLLLVAVVAPVDAEDWPQWMGPTRDNVWHEDGLLESFPDGGPPVVWRTDVAGGYAGPAVADGKVFVTDYVTGDEIKIANFERKNSTGVERVLCLDEATGKELWRHEYPVTYTISYPAGPRCTPAVHAGKVYTLGAEGNLFCLDAESGEVLWSKDFPNDYGAKTSLWGYASSPLVDGEKLLCVVGGEGSHAVAFDLNTGNEIWKSLTCNDQGYSPPTIIHAGGVRQLVLLCPDKVAAVEPETGKEYWRAPYEATSGSIIMSPVVSGNYLFAGGYNNQSLMLKLASDKPDAEVLWGNESKHGISPVNVQPIVQESIMYGVNGSGDLMAVEFPSGERLWETSKPISERPVSSGTAFIVRQADRYWLFNEQGELIISRLTPEGYEEIDRAKIIEPTNNAFGREVVWCMPAFANRKLFVRNDEECICVDLAAE
ncbi:PQQ-binding-like beta-propeller repeat protein [Bythopirellula polymerisocia]|uniref:Outer membrane biogenesis protein BamB n=1 Tax=Bythopirellula polymerisocia TaxID=2528003 RepID=A0A5C6CWA1_9BACT|nr:PQQ-binding-like beta-propeller repeat protein [Bythopirellula polymerisocia]TWU28135.1 outer membrane biogenesis protein BamB [Bythopirellula polymerisocia]